MLSSRITAAAVLAVLVLAGPAARPGAEPEMALSPDSLGFVGLQGAGDPPPQEVRVLNVGGGVLGIVSAAIEFFEGDGWLTVARTGTDNQQTVLNTISVSGLTPGVYTATVRVSCTHATNSPVSYGVTLDYADELRVTTVELSAQDDRILPGTSTDVTARLFDQLGGAIAEVVHWSVSGGGGMSPETSPGAATAHISRFTSDGNEGAYTVTAEAGGVDGTLPLFVSRFNIPDVRINCGSNDYDVIGWERDDAYVTGGFDWTNPDDVDTTGVDDAAPPGVYKSVRHTSPHDYSIPVPDGTYTLRFHFADAYTDRHMDYTVEGDLVLQDFDIASEAGGVNRALVREFTVVVSDGDGLQIEARAAGDVFEAGIEVQTAPVDEPAPDGDGGPGDPGDVPADDAGPPTDAGARDEGCAGCGSAASGPLLAPLLLLALACRPCRRNLYPG